MAPRSGPTTPDPTRPRRKNTLRRADLAPGDCLCDHCSGKCCKYFSLPFETPTRWKDFDAIRGYLALGKTLVYVEKKTWYLVVMTRCGYLAEDNRCRIYFDRPKICRDYTTAECEYDEDWIFEKVFEAPDQVREYAEAVLGRRRSPEPPDVAEPRSFSLPIETPATWDDYDAIRWYLAHGSSQVYARGGDWFLRVLHGSSVPELDPPVDRLFDAPEQVWEYAESVLPRRKKPIPPASPLIVLNNPPGPRPG